ncbi:hypothetical protein N5T63_04595 [Aliarcobacter cryaerophilus]|uniref:cupin domain-containing protein n=1 Tax=Aliarcobacter cryaerophilus TaxID=28198 RepID=UPI0021B4921B|nr:hypothetical protein [Aliarcobacter cryaerophilus]MCT7488188.1 hypothetical protein [Aliarcobacter cryaerophilus]MCT7505315.1 hypothetical protein [Aliarcobacter cryaerophilus]
MSSVKNIFKILENAKIDKKVGIKLAKILDGESFNLYCLEIAPKKRVTAHYHSFGNETYQIIKGKAVMMIGVQENDTIKWQEPKKMYENDCLNVKANEIHQLINTENSPLICIVTCSISHITNDRVITTGYEKEIN